MSNAFFPFRTHSKTTQSEKSALPDNFVRGSATGASLRASSRGELGSSMLQRSARSRKSNKSLGDGKV